MADNYRGSVRLTPVRESHRIKREGSRVVLGPPEGYGSGDVKVGDRVYIIPGCGSGSQGGYGVVTEPEGPDWLKERGWVGVLEDDGDVRNHQKRCLWVKT